MNYQTTLDFKPKTEEPTSELNGRTFLIYNRCDGYHVVEAMYNDVNEFEFFYFFAGSDVELDFFEAWAVLPDCNNELRPVFVGE